MTADDMKAAERAFADSEIYQKLRRRTHAITTTAGLRRSLTTCPVTSDEMTALEDAAPMWMRFLTPEGAFTLGPFGWHFAVADVPPELVNV